MICLRNIVAVSIPVIIGFMYLFVFVDAHVGAECTDVLKLGALKYCTGQNTVCVDDICQCKLAYPVLINPHVCLKERWYREKCEDTLQCTHYDTNTYCTLGSIQSFCDCKDDFEFSEISKKCQKKVVKVEKSSTVSLPGAIIITVAIVGSICALLLLMHYFFRRQSHVRLMAIISSCHSDIPMSEPNNQRSTPAQCDNTTNLLSSNPNADPLPSYETAISLEPVDNREPSVDIECPPSYEEVMKGSVIKLDETKNIST